MTGQRLGIGFIGSGFNARFHLEAMVEVRDADVLGVWSPTRRHAADTAALARKLGVGEAKPYSSITAMAADPSIHALWLCGPNHARSENVEEIADAVERGRGALLGLACEKPLGRNVAEAKHVTALARRAELNHGYLENQVFAPQVAGPHSPWFWQGALQGGGVLNDMMCHSALVVRHLLTQPGADAASVRPRRIAAHIASLKWSQPAYAKRLSTITGGKVDYRRRPAEDFANMVIEFETDDGRRVLGEATTSWSFVGAGLRLSAELLGPEYSMAWNTLDSGLKLFFSRDVRGRMGEDMVEKQNAETGLMPVVAGEAAAYGYEAEDRHFVRAFLRGERPALTFDDGLEVVRMLMTAYMSAEQGRTLAFPPHGLDTLVPAVARGRWKP